eukprot:scaffold272156_cov26-Tisochrysis_lutea.AAC.1
MAVPVRQTLRGCHLASWLPPMRLSSHCSRMRNRLARFPEIRRPLMPAVAGEARGEIGPLGEEAGANALRKLSPRESMCRGVDAGEKSGVMSSAVRTRRSTSKRQQTTRGCSGPSVLDRGLKLKARLSGRPAPACLFSFPKLTALLTSLAILAGAASDEEREKECDDERGDASEGEREEEREEGREGEKDEAMTSASLRSPKWSPLYETILSHSRRPCLAAAPAHVTAFPQSTVKPYRPSSPAGMTRGMMWPWTICAPRPRVLFDQFG